MEKKTVITAVAHIVSEAHRMTADIIWRTQQKETGAGTITEIGGVKDAEV